MRKKDVKKPDIVINDSVTTREWFGIAAFLSVAVPLIGLVLWANRGVGI